jgi:hypothetical protein
MVALGRRENLTAQNSNSKKFRHVENNIAECCVCDRTDYKPPPGLGFGFRGMAWAADMSDDLSLIQIAMRVGMSCALTAVMAVGIFMVIRFVAWVG